MQYYDLENSKGTSKTNVIKVAVSHLLFEIKYDLILLKNRVVSNYEIWFTSFSIPVNLNCST